MVAGLSTGSPVLHRTSCCRGWQNRKQRAAPAGSGFERKKKRATPAGSGFTKQRSCGFDQAAGFKVSKTAGFNRSRRENGSCGFSSLGTKTGRTSKAPATRESKTSGRLLDREGGVIKNENCSGAWLLDREGDGKTANRRRKTRAVFFCEPRKT